MSEKIINLFWQFWNQWLKYRNVDPVVGFARLLVLVGVGLMAPGGVWWLALALEIKLVELPASVTIKFGPETITYTGLFIATVGILIGIWGIRHIKKKRTSCLIYMRGLPGMNDEPPTDDLPPKYKHGQVTHLSMDILKVSKESAIENIELFSKMLDEKIMSMDIEAPVTVFAGLAQVPLLYVTGIRLSTRQNLFVMDYNRFEQKWHMLDELDDNERIETIYPDNPPGEEVAIAMPFTISMTQEQIPVFLKDKTIWIKLDGQGPRTDAFSSEEKMKHTLRAVHDVIRNLRNKDGYGNIKRIHLFIAAQASTVFKLGTNYQANVYPEICVYHFQGGEGKYTWGIGIKNGAIKILQEVGIDD